MCATKHLGRKHQLPTCRGTPYLKSSSTCVVLNEGTTKTIESSQDAASDDDDMVIMSTSSSSAQATTSADVVGALGGTYAAAVNGVRCFLSSEHEYADLVQSVLAVAATTTICTTDKLTVWYKCTYSKKDLLLQEDCFEKYRYKLVNGYVAATTNGAVIFDVLTESAAFRAPGSPTLPLQQQQQPRALSLALSKPEVAPATPGASARGPQTPDRRRRHHSVPLRRSSPAPTRVEKRRSSCPPRFSERQKEQIAHLFSGSRNDPIVID
ncbi:hypothetical protein BZA05DRAFT_443628 [Tricharina praecox]|uniref:uncharacterized protein n=1 Tax=Tricharina praecox TaxID=43433 RepID=UPI00221FF388|nr:uncharacterized protein BZA05DRAFT_443628 [Tricharina praecox]KAI5854109.1 hypothetical protein BZA05DRAFT_443628 [Tricharina praecox]